MLNLRAWLSSAIFVGEGSPMKELEGYAYPEIMWGLSLSSNSIFSKPLSKEESLSFGIPVKAYLLTVWY